MDVTFEVPGRRTRMIRARQQKFLTDNFSLKNTLKDIGKLSIQPIKTAVASITGKPDNTVYDTKLGKAAGGISKAIDTSVNAAAKGFANTITGGLATKATNVLRKDEYKEKAFRPNETQIDSGIGFIDKAAPTAQKIGTGLGAAFGVYSAASGLKGLVDKNKAAKAAGSGELADLGSKAATLAGGGAAPLINNESMTLQKALEIGAQNGGALTGWPKSIADIAKQVTQSKVGQSVANIANAIPKAQQQQIINAAKGKGAKILSGIIGNNQTSPELLPKTASTKKAEQEVINAGGGSGLPQTGVTFIDQYAWPLIIGIIVLIIIIVLATRK